MRKFTNIPQWVSWRNWYYIIKFYFIYDVIIVSSYSPVHILVAAALAFEDKHVLRQRRVTFCMLYAHTGCDPSNAYVETRVARITLAYVEL